MIARPKREEGAMLARIDAVIGRPFIWFLDNVSYVTGKRGAGLARIMGLASFSLQFLEACIDFQERQWVNGLTEILVLAVLIPGFLNLVTVVERLQRKNAETIALPEIAVLLIMGVRISMAVCGGIFLVMGVAQGTGRTVLESGAQLFYAAAMFALLYQGGKKSWLASLVDHWQAMTHAAHATNAA